MILRAQNPPHIRSRESNQTLMGDAVIATLPLYAMAAYFYGYRALTLAAVGVVCAVLSEFICLMISRKGIRLRDHSALVTGLLIPLMLPASVSWHIVAVGAVFAIVVAKHPFGGTGNNIFNPAAAGFAFVAVCWPKAVFSYPMVFDRIPPLAPDVSVRLVGSPLHALQLGGVPTTDIMDMLLGNCPGPMGATNILVLMTCLIYLAVRKSASLRMALSFLAGAAIVAAVFVRAPLTPLYSVLYELMSGLALFGAVFLINDPVTSPRRKDAMVVYGFLTGAVFMLLRSWGRFEESLPFAILLMNSLVWSIDIMCEHFAHALRRKSFEQDLREIL